MSLYQQGITLKALLENPELLNPPKASTENKEKKKDGDLSDIDLFQGQSAFLGPTLWDKTLPVDVSDFKLEYMDLDEFLNENVLDDNATPTVTNATENVTASTPSQPLLQPSSPGKNELKSPITTDCNPLSVPSMSSSAPPLSPQVHFDVPQQDLALVSIPGQQQFDPKKRAFSEEELRPQPMIKKSKKVFVPDNQKDDKYWQRRNKNNVAAKRSRDARRIKENQIAMRAAYLERENDKLKEELEKMKQDNKTLTTRLAKYEPEITL